jgi:hypothetical protein
MPELGEPAARLLLREKGTCSCGARRHATDPNRCARGHMFKGNVLALQDGARSGQFWNAVDSERRQLVAAIVEDAGYALADAPKSLHLAADSLAQACLLQHAAFLRLAEVGGPFAQTGRARQSFLVWSAATDKVIQFARLLGLRRHSKPIDPFTLMEQVATREDEQASQERTT